MTEESIRLWHRQEPEIGRESPGREPAGAMLIGRPVVPLRVYLRRTAWDAIDEWANAFTPPREVGGLLLGKAWRDARGPVILVEGILPATEGMGSPGQFRFTHGDWVAFREAWQRLGAAHLVVGWFHTHPGNGTSLSGYDRVVAQRFFPEWWQLTYVIDPVNLRQAMYHWEDGQLSPLAGFWVYETEEPPLVDPLAPSVAAVAAATERAPSRSEAGRRRWTAAWVAMLFTLATLAWLPGFPGSLPWLRASLRQQATEASRLVAELDMLRDRHDLLQQMVAEARQVVANSVSDQPSPPAGGAMTASPAPLSAPSPAAAPAATGPAGSNPAAPSPAVSSSDVPGPGGPAAADSSAGAAGPRGRTETPPSAATATIAGAATRGDDAPPAAPVSGRGNAPAAPPAMPVMPNPAASRLTLGTEGKELRYVVREGDTLWSISGRLLGDPRAYSRLAAVNRIADPDLILPGWELRVPVEEEPGQ